MREVGPGVTHVVPGDSQRWVDRAWQRVREEVDAGHQAFVVCPRIGDDLGSEPDEGDTPPDDEARRPPLAAVEVLEQLVRLRGKPKSLRVDNGPEFAGRLLDHWAYLNGVEIDFSRPGKPTDNAFIEAFNARPVARQQPWPVSDT